MDVEARFRFLRAEMERCAAILRRHGGYAVPDPMDVRVRLDLKGRARGTAQRHEQGGYLIRLNLAVWDQVGDRYAQTIAHEYAHVVCFASLAAGRIPARGYRPHGAAWKAVMRRLGYADDKASDYGPLEVVKARRTRRFVYGCPSCGHQYDVTKGQHEKAATGRARYRCTKCLRLGTSPDACTIAYEGRERMV